MSVKTSRGAVSKPATATTTASSQKQSTLKSAFSPSPFQLHLFASIIQGFESQQLRVHDTKTGRLRCSHNAEPGTNITCLDWGQYGVPHQENTQKKRKRDPEQDIDIGSAVLAYGTDRSEIRIFSPTELKIVGRLSGAHERGIRDFKFSKADFSESWSLGGDGKLVQWDLKTLRPRRSIALPDSSVATIASFPYLHHDTDPSTSQLLCASATPYAVTLTSATDEQIQKFDAFKSPIRHILLPPPDGVNHDDVFLAADRDRYINMYSIPQNKLIRTLNASAGVVDFSVSADSQGYDTTVLAVTTNNGLVELFTEPFAAPKPASTPTTTTKAKLKGLTRKANASIKIISPNGKDSSVAVFQALVQGPEIVVACADGGVDVSFQKIRWQDEGNGELLFDGMKEVVRTKSANLINSATMNGVKNVDNVHVDESKTVVGNTITQRSSQTAIEISSEDEADDETDASAEDQALAENPPDEAETALGSHGPREELDTEMADAAEHVADGEIEDDTQEPSFGEQLAKKYPGTITIADADGPAQSSAVVSSQPANSLLAPSGMTLTVTLSQALRTNDQHLLESCLHHTSVNTIRGTIQRLDSGLAGVLLQKLAERLSSRPGRYGKLSDWVEWTCVVHGGAIMGRPDVVSKIKSLYQTLSLRSKCMDSLLLLRGKLDMLHSQMELRKGIQAQRQPHDLDDERDVYIEGQDDNFSSDEDQAAEAEVVSVRPAPGKKSLDEVMPDEESEEDEVIPLTNGVLHSDEEVSRADSEGDLENKEDEQEGLIQDEAIESGTDSDQSDREASESEEEDDEDADSEMDEFIDDASIGDEEVGSEVSVDDTPEQPPRKKSKK